MDLAKTFAKYSIAMKSLGSQSMSSELATHSDTAALNPVILLVTVKEGANPLHAHSAAMDCRDCLENYQIYDVHAEFMEMHKSYDYSKYYRYSVIEHLETSYASVPPIGASIGPRLDRDYQASGSLGLYMQVKPKNSEREAWQQCGLTCHHVLFPLEADSHLGNSSHREIEPRVFVDSPSTEGHKESVDCLQSIKEMYDYGIKELETERRLAEQGIEKPLEAREVSALQESEALAAEASLKEKAIQSFHRDMGEVIATSRNNNWALFELDKVRVPEIVINSVPPFTFSAGEKYEINSKLHHSDRLNCYLFKLNVDQNIPLKEIQSPQMRDIDGFPSYRVIKFGKATGWTVGVSNEILSDCQCEPGIITTEWCIIDNSVFKGQFFSEKGDSGSFVCYFRGRLGGMIHGWDDYRSAPLTYVTHVDSLFQSIKEEFDMNLV